MSDDSQPQPNPDAVEFAVEPTVERAIEALLFVSDRPLTAPQIAKVLEEEAGQVEQALESLRAFYEERGIRILVHGDAYQMCSAPEAAAYCRRLLGMDSEGRLTQASLEALGIVAYKQPVTRAEIERVRGVNSDSSISLLMARGLIAPVGRGDQVGRPVLYGTTPGFLAYFGLPSLASLPQVELPELQAGLANP